MEQARAWGMGWAVHHFTSSIKPSLGDKSRSQHKLRGQMQEQAGEAPQARAKRDRLKQPGQPRPRETRGEVQPGKPGWGRSWEGCSWTHDPAQQESWRGLKNPLLQKINPASCVTADPLIHRITESQNSRGWKGPLWVI